VPVVERRHQPDVLDSSTPLPNTSPDMSPTPTAVKSSVSGLSPSAAKCHFTDSQARAR
jgi:hypothetical protein